VEARNSQFPEPFIKWANPGFLADLIPIIPPGANLSVGSKVTPEMLGKVPGQYLGNGIWCGFAKFTQHFATEVDIARWNSWPGAGVGLLARNHPAVDIDCLDPGLAEKVSNLAFEILGPAPIRVGNAPKRLLLYRGSPLSKRRLVFESGDAIEILGAGQQFVVDGIHPKTGRPYTWDRDPTALDLSEITEAQVEAFRTECAALAPVKSRAKDLQREAEQFRTEPAASVQHSDDLTPLKQLLAYLDPGGGEDDWWPVIAAIEASPMGTEAEREALAVEWSRGDYSAGVKPGNWKSDADVRAKFEGKKLRRVKLEARGEKVVGFGSLVKWALEAGMPWATVDASVFNKPLDATSTANGPAEELEDPFAPRLLASPDLDTDGGDWPVAFTGEFRETPARELEELIPGLVEKHIVTYLEGTGGIGKSLIALQDAFRVASGRSVYDLSVEQAGVLYLHYEDDADELKRRLRRLIEYYDPYDRRFPGCPETSDTSQLFVWQLKQHPRPIMRVKANGEIWTTHFGERFLHCLAERRDCGQHTFVVFDGIIDAIRFDAGTRNDDAVARQVIHELDRLAVEYDFSAYAILHPSRAGERTDTGSYAPAWSTRPRAIQTFKKVLLKQDGWVSGMPVPVGSSVTERLVKKRSHGPDGATLHLLYHRGAMLSALERRGGERPVDVAVSIAAREAAGGRPICRNPEPKIGNLKLTRHDYIVQEFATRTGKQRGALAGLMQALAEAEAAKRLVYLPHAGRRAAGYYSASDEIEDCSQK
jgi:hypothetical protein